MGNLSKDTIANELKELEDKKLEQRTKKNTISKNPIPYVAEDVYSSNAANKVTFKDKYLNKKILNSIMNSTRRILIQVFWNLVAIALLICVFLIVYDLMGWTFLKEYFEGVKSGVTGYFMDQM